MYMSIGFHSDEHLTASSTDSSYEPCLLALIVKS